MTTRGLQSRIACPLDMADNAIWLLGTKHVRSPLHGAVPYSSCLLSDTAEQHSPCCLSNDN